MLACLGKRKTTAYKFFGGRNAVERTVGRLNFGLFGLAEPAALTTVQFVQQLGIKLGVVDGSRTVDGMLHFHTDETAAARKVGQQVAAITCTDE